LAPKDESSVGFFPPSASASALGEREASLPALAGRFAADPSASPSFWCRRPGALSTSEVTAAALKMEGIHEALEAVRNERTRGVLQRRLEAAQRELDEAIANTAVAPPQALAPPPVAASPPAQKPKTTRSVNSRFKGVYGVESLKKGTVRWTAKLLRGNQWYRDGSHDAEEDAARAVDRRLRSWNRDDECNFTVDGEERPLEERKRGGSASKRRAPGGSGGGARKKQQTDSAGRDANPKRLRVAASRDDDDDQEPEDDDDDDDEHEPYDLLDRPSGFGALAPLSGDVLVLADKDKQEATKPPPQPHHDADDDDDARGAPLSDRGAGEAATANV